MFAAIIAAQIASTENAPVLFLFFRESRPTSHHPRFLIHSFIYQLLDYSHYLQLRARAYFHQQQAIDKLSLKELWDVLVHALSTIPKVYCIIDGLDEMGSDQETFLHDLVALCRLKPKSIKILMTSRPLPRIERI